MPAEPTHMNMYDSTYWDRDGAMTADDYPHDWQHGRYTGTLTCSGCHLLPLDDDDIDTPCPATAVRMLSDEGHLSDSK